MPASALATILKLVRPHTVTAGWAQPATSSMVNNKQQITLPAGQHQLVLQFEGSLIRASRLIRGEPVAFNLDMKADDNIAINFTYPPNYREAKLLFRATKPASDRQKQARQPRLTSFRAAQERGAADWLDYQQELTDLGKAFQTRA